MKVCIISSLYPPFTRGGAEWMAYDEANALAAEGHDVTVITTRIWGGLRSLRGSVEHEGAVRILRFFPVNFFSYYHIGSHWFPMRILWHLIDYLNIEAALVVRRFLKREKPDLVITHNLKGLGFLVPMVIRSLKLSHTHVVHDVQLAVPSGLLRVGDEEGFIDTLYSHFTRWAFGTPTIVRSPSRWLIDFYAKRGFFKGGSFVHAMHRPLFLNTQEPIPRTARDNTNIVFVGQVTVHKGIVFLLSVWKQMLKEGTVGNAKLHIIGTGRVLNKLKVMLDGEPSVIFHGPLTHEEISKWYAVADAVVVPSLVYENAPSVILEAHSHGVPVIATDAGGIPELTGDKDTLVGVEDIEGWKKALVKYIKNVW